MRRLGHARAARDQILRVGVGADADGDALAHRRRRLDVLLVEIIVEAAIHHLRDLPQGVEYHCRESENARYHFYINTTQSAVKVQVESGADLLSGKNVLGSMELKPYDACAIEEKVK
jgi:beta-galactosidase GanA